DVFVFRICGSGKNSCQRIRPIGHQDNYVQVVGSMSLQVAINAQLMPESGVGGTLTVLTGLVHALAQLEGSERYVLIGPWENPDWLKPYSGDNQVFIRGPKPQSSKGPLKSLKQFVKAALRSTTWTSGKDFSRARLRRSNGFYEGLGCQVI